MGSDSLLQATDPRHKYLRGLLAPAFSPEAVGSYVPAIVSLMQRHVQEWAAAGDEGVKGLDSFKLLTFDFIVEVRPCPTHTTLHTASTLCAHASLGAFDSTPPHARPVFCFRC